MAPVVAAQAAPMSPRAEAQQVERRGARYAGSGEDVTLNRTGTQNYAASPAGGAPAGLGSGPILKTAAQQNALQAASWPADPDPDQAAGDPDLPFGGTPAPESARVAASPSAMVAPAPQHHGAAVAKQIAAALQTNGPGQTEIVLDPQELGRVSLSLSSADGSITVAIVADRPETMDLIRRHLESLSQELRDIGYASVDVSFSGSSQQRGGRGHGDAPPGMAAAPPPAEGLPASDLSAPPTMRRDGGLDIRL